MKPSSFLMLAACALSLTGCGKFFDKFSSAPEGHSNVRFSDGRRNLTAAMDGGLIVYAIRQDGTHRAALHLTNASDPKVFTLPNGQYKFRAVGWTASGMSGVPKCGGDTSPLPIALTGAAGTVTVEIAVSDAACDAAPFTDASIQPSGLNPAQLVFCAATAANFAGKAYVDKCLNEESARFLKPGAGIGAVGGYTDYDTDTGRFLFLSDQYAVGRDDLYSVKADGTGIVRQNNPLASGRNVYDFILLKGRGKVAYASDEVTDNQYDLWVSTVGTRGGTLVNNGDACSGCAGVDALYLTPDHSKLIVVGDMDTPGIRELYKVDLTAASYTLVKISETIPTDGTGLLAEYQNLEISPDSLYATYTSFHADSTTRELFTVRLSDGLVRKVSHASPTTGSEVRAFFQNHNGTKVVWMSDPAADVMLETFASEIFPASPDPKIVSGPPGFAGDSYGRLAISRNADLVAFTMRNDSSKDEVHYANFSNLASIQEAAALSVGEIPAIDPAFNFLAFVTDGTNHRLVIGGDAEVAFMNELWVKDVAFPGSAAVKVSHATMSTGISLESAAMDLALLDYNTAYYIADRVTQEGQNEAWKVNLGGAANNATNVAQTPAVSETFQSIAAAYGKIFLRFFDGSLSQPFLHDPTGSAANSTALSVGTMESLDSVEVPRHSESFPGYPYGAFYRGLADGSGTAANTVKDLFFLANHSTSTPVRISNMFGGASGTGGVKLRLLAYTSGGGTALTEVGTGIESACITAPSVNGDQTGHAIELPLGMAGGTGPLAVALEVYTGTEACAGTPDRIIFPHGLANPSVSTAPSKVRLTSSGSSVRLYLND